MTTQSPVLQIPKPEYKFGLMIFFLLLAIGIFTAKYYVYQSTTDTRLIAMRDIILPFIAAFPFTLFLLCIATPNIIVSMRKSQLEEESNLTTEGLVKYFELGKLSKESWHHSEHLRVASYYLYHEESASEAMIKMRCGLIRYGVLRNPQIVCTERYHETITQFWIYEINSFMVLNSFKSFEEFETALNASELADKNYIYKHYTQETLNLPIARASYIESSYRM